MVLRKNQLDLPDGSRVHPVFHVSLLNKVLSPTITPILELPVMDEEGAFVVTPATVWEKDLFAAPVVRYTRFWSNGPRKTPPWLLLGRMLISFVGNFPTLILGVKDLYRRGVLLGILCYLFQLKRSLAMDGRNSGLKKNLFIKMESWKVFRLSIK